MATEQRLKAAFEAADAPKAALALAKLEAVAAVSIKGHPDAILNGIFKVDSEHADGRLVLKNDKGGHCHRYAGRRLVAVLEGQAHREALRAVHSVWRRRPALAAVRAPSERRIEEQVVSDDSLARARLQKRRVGLRLGVV